MKASRSCIFSNSMHALAGLIRCKCCDGVLVQVSIKRGGYYGCDNARKHSCKNKLRLSRRGVEAIILNDLKEKFLTVQSLEYADELVLEDLLGVIELEPVLGKRSLTHVKSLIVGWYYVTHTSIQSIALLEEEFNLEP